MWYFLISVPMLLFSIGAMIDTFLMKKFGQDEKDGILHSRIGTFMLISGILAIVVCLLLLPWVYQAIFALSRDIRGWLVVWWVIYGMAWLPYFKALQIENVENIRPVFMTIPLFAYVIGALLIGEFIPWTTLLVIVLIAVWVSLFYIDLSNYRFNTKAAWWAFLSALWYSLSYVFFKKWWLAEDNLMVSLFREHMGVFLTWLWYLLHTKVRKTTRLYFRDSWWRFSLLNASNEILYRIAKMTTSYLTLRYLIVYVTIISNGLQVLVLFAMKYIAHQYMPDTFEWPYTRRHILWKMLIALVLMILMGYIIQKI